MRALADFAFRRAKVALRDATFAERLTFFGHTEKHVFLLTAVGRSI
jgi:hypothetical protein